MPGPRAFALYIFLCCFSFSLFSQNEFNPLAPDYEYLNRLVLEHLNNKRVKKGKSKMVPNEHLQKTAVYYTDRFVFRKFENLSLNKFRINKKIKRFCLDNGFNSKLINFNINTCHAINFYGSKYYYDRDDSTSDLHLFIGEKKPSVKEKREEKFKSIPLKKYTYEQLATEIVKKFVHDEGHFKSLNNAYDQIGISCVVEPKSLGRKKIPMIKAIIIVGGKLINW